MNYNRGNDIDEYIGVVAGKSGDSIVKELHQWGFKTAIVCGKENEHGYDDSEKKYVCDLSEKALIYQFFVSNGIDKVLFGTGHILAIELAEYLEERNFCINISPKISLLCNDKYRLKEVVECAGFDTPAFTTIYYNDNLNDKLCGIKREIGFPCVIKSIRDVATPRLVFDKIDFLDGVKELFKHEESILVEQYIQGKDCTSVVLNSDNQTSCLLSIPWSKSTDDKLKGFPQTKVQYLSQNEKKSAQKITEEIVKTVNVPGICRVDYILNDGKLYFLEINSIIFTGNLEGSEYNLSLFLNNVNLSKVLVDISLKKMFCQSFKHLRREEHYCTFIDDSINEKTRNNTKETYITVLNDALAVQENSPNSEKTIKFDEIKELLLYKGNDNISKYVKARLKEKRCSNYSESDIQTISALLGFMIMENADRYNNCALLNKELIDTALKIGKRYE